MIYIVFLFGLLLGSFYNVCIYRLPVGKSVVIPRSTCGHCGHVLGGLDMIPVLSYFIFRGRCRYCGGKYSGRYALVELLTGLLFAMSYWVYGYSLELVFAFILSSICIIVTFIDIDHHIILDRFSVFLILLAIPYHYFISDLSIKMILLGFAVGFGLLFIISVVGTMGGGDIKIMGGFGLLLGFPNILLAIYLSFIIGGLVFTPVLLKSKITKQAYKSQVPFGPFLCVGALIAFMFGNHIIDIYMNWVV